MELIDKLEILAEGAKYDAACTSSGVTRDSVKGTLGNTRSWGICHSFSADGRCISLLKVLLTNYCIYDCQYCVNRRSNDVPRAMFEPRELADLVIGFYRRNYIEGLFISTGVIKNPDYTMEQMIIVLKILREEYLFGGYIHAKTIPGASRDLIDLIGTYADRISVNLELPSEDSLKVFAPDKPKQNILKPMGMIRDGIKENRHDMVVYKKSPKFAPAGQSTQMIIGATPETDFQIVRLAESLYKKYDLRRVFYSAYMPVGTHELLPKNQPIPLLREHRLYQADWLIRVYGFKSNEILSEKAPHLDPFLDPKCNWAINNLEYFPVEINTAEYESLLRVPGIGDISAKKIIAARKTHSLSFDHLKKLGILLKRAAYFITCSGRYMKGMKFDFNFIYDNLTIDVKNKTNGLPLENESMQMTLFDKPLQQSLIGSQLLEK